MWVGAETGTEPGADFVTIFEPWSSRDDRDQDWYETKKRSLPSWQLHQEYPQTPDEAFIKSGNPFFDVEQLAEWETFEPRKGVLVARDFVTFVEQEGNLAVWALPEHEESYVIGADVAEGLEHGDYCSAHVIRWKTRDVVAVWHGHIPPDEFAEILANLGKFYNGALIGVENNNHGLTTCKYLKDWHRYPNIFYARVIDERTKRATNKIGWTTSKKTKPKMLDDLAQELRERTLGLWDRGTVGELRTFVRDENGRLHGSPFDDRVMSLAVAVQMLDYAVAHKAQRGEAVYGTLGWWDQKLRAPVTHVPIGAHNRR